MELEEMISDIKEVQPFFYGNIAEMFIAKGYRKESDTAREILDMIDGVPTNEVNELNHLRLLKNAIVKRYGVDLTEDKE